MAISLSYNDDFSRVQLTASGLGPDEVRVERSTNELNWRTVRGGVAIDSSSGSIALDDYDGWIEGDENFYRVVDTADDSVEESDSITPSLGGEVWLKSVSHTFLNQAVTVSDFSAVARPARMGVFPVVGRAAPVTVTDVRALRQYTLDLVAKTPEAERNLELALVTADVIFLHVPASGNLSLLPGSMYAVVGDFTKTRIGAVSDWLLFSLPLTETAAPGPDVVGGTMTNGALLSQYGSYQALATANSSYAALADLIADPDDLVVLD